MLLAAPPRWLAAAGFLLAAGLPLVFATAIAASLRRGNRAPCRCFGASSAPLVPGHIARNAVLVAVALRGLASTFGPRSATVTGAVAAGSVGLIAGALLTVYDDLAALLRPVR